MNNNNSNSIFKNIHRSVITQMMTHNYYEHKMFLTSSFRVEFTFTKN